MAIQTREHFDANCLDVSLKHIIVTGYGQLTDVVEVHGAVVTPSGKHCKFVAFAHVDASYSKQLVTMLENNYKKLRSCPIERDLESKTYKDDPPPISALTIVGIPFVPSPAH